MKGLIERLGRGVKGVLTGFDRIVFKGHILPLMHAEGAMGFLRWRGILNKDYKRWMLERSAALVSAVDRYARERCGQEIQHRNSWREDKEALAKARQKATGITSGLIGAWSFLESGRSYRAHYDAEAGHPQLRPYTSAHKHLYVYLDHEDYGLMNLRIQTWFPYSIQIAMNGRQWLRRSLEKRQVDVVMEGNKCLDVADYDQAQECLDEQLDRRWPALLNGLLPIGFPTLRETLGPHLGYYWTLWQSEWASDIVMESPAELKATMDALVRHAVLTGTSTRVLRYMGRPITASGRPHAGLTHDVTSRVLDFHEGVRVRHWVDQNSIKIYNEYNVLRCEMTMNWPGMFRVYRRAQGEPASAPKQRRALRKGVADIPLRAKVSQEIIDRFSEGVATFSEQTPLRDVLRPHARTSTRAGRRVRALDPTGKDRELLEAIADPAYAVSGITNHALRDRLARTSWGARRTERQLSARITRHLRLLRDHRLIRKVPNQRRYQLTPKGQRLVTALSAMLGASTQQLMEMVA
ncbi:MAG: hypothetical protein AAB403_06075 [Planctomycetota bacterium]